MPYYLQQFKDKLTGVKLISVLDSGTMDYDTVWVSNALRGVVSVTVNVTVSLHSMHSGDAGGVIPDAYRIARVL